MPITSTQITINGTAQEIVAPDRMTQHIVLHNHEHSAGHAIYIGGNSSVTVNNGLHLTAELEITLDIGPGDALWAISNNNAEIHILKVTQD